MRKTCEQIKTKNLRKMRKKTPFALNKLDRKKKRPKFIREAIEI